jgi:hypothetical protein
MQLKGREMNWNVDPEDEFKESVLRSMMVICMILMMIFVALVFRGNF